MSLKPVAWPHVAKALATDDVRGRSPTWAIWYTPSQGQLSSEKVPMDLSEWEVAIQIEEVRYPRVACIMG